MTLTQTLEHPLQGLRAPQAEVCGLRLHPGVRRGPEQGHRRHRHRAGLEPLCVWQRRYAARHSDLFATDLDEQTLIRYIDRLLMFYVRTGDRLQRTSVWMENMEGGSRTISGR